MRKYFWELGEIHLKAWTEKYMDYMDKPNEEDICLMIHNNEDVCVGYIALNWMNERGGSTGIYVEIYNKYRRRGYGTAAMEIMLEYAFMERRFHKVQGCTKSNEPGTENFLYQLGFVFEAVRTNMFIIDGQKVAEYYYGMTESEYHDLNRLNHSNQKAPMDYMTPIYSSLGEKEGDDFSFSYVDYKNKDNCFYYDGLKFRGTTIEDYLINNNIIYDSQICRWYDDDVKIPGLTDKVEQFEINHLNYKMDDGRLEFAIEDQGEYIGCVNLCGIEKEHDRVSASIYLRTECRRMGYGTRAMRFALSYAAKELQCHTVILCVSNGNIASARMMRKLGLKLGGVQREAAFVGGTYVDTLFFEK